MTDGSSVFGTLVDNKQKKIKKNWKNFQRQKLTNKYKMQSENSWLFRCNIKFGWWYIPPFYKPNKETNYIHFKPDHTPQITKKIPKSIEKRLSCISSTKEIFENSEIN